MLQHAPSRALRLFLKQLLIGFEFIAMANVFAAGIPVLLKYAHKEDEELASWVERLINGSTFASDPELFRQQWFHILLARAVDNFNSYLADILHDVFSIRPEILKSGEKIEVREVLDCSSIEEVSLLLAARKVDDLTYGGFPSIHKFLVEKIGVRAYGDSKRVQLVTEAIAARNLIVHNRARINQRFTRDTGKRDVQIGEPLQMDRDTLSSYIHSLEDVAKYFDDQLVGKFGIDLIHENSS